jgi:cob(I)alamin adenosyltransferase
MRSGPPFIVDESERMSRPARIYTRSGDDGTTGLVGGQRLSKQHRRIECFGTIDECSCAIGLARRALADRRSAARAAELDGWLAWIQDSLFNLGSDLATLPKDRTETMPRIVQADVDALERAIDRAQGDLPPLDAFIHPGGSYAGGFLNLARTVCRRAERLMVGLSESEAEPVEPVAIRFVNRLSDALFVWARWINQEFGEPEHRWNPNSTPPL